MPDFKFKMLSRACMDAVMECYNYAQFESSSSLESSDACEFNTETKNV